MKFYKILHKPTGMYCTTAQGGSWTGNFLKRHLSKKGKVYQNYPFHMMHQLEHQMKWAGKGLYTMDDWEVKEWKVE